MRKVSIRRNVWIGEKVQVLYELVTVICKLRLSYHWETGKESHKRLSNQSGDLPFAVQERKVHATSNWQYER